MMIITMKMTIMIMLVMMIDNNADNDRMMTICKNEPTCHMLTNLVP